MKAILANRFGETMFTKDHIVQVVENKRINITVHAIRRMHERNILMDDICEVLKQGALIEEYRDDYPYPSCLIMGRLSDRIFHVVCSFSDPLYIITAYEPDLTEWENDYRTRKKVK